MEETLAFALAVVVSRSAKRALVSEVQILSLVVQPCLVALSEVRDVALSHCEAYSLESANRGVRGLCESSFDRLHVSTPPKSRRILLASSYLGRRRQR